MKTEPKWQNKKDTNDTGKAFTLFTYTVMFQVKMLVVKMLQFVFLVLGKPGREARMRSTQWHSNFVSNQKKQNINVRTCEKEFSNSIHVQEFYRVFII